MSTLKTHKAAAKRFKITGRGKLRRRKQMRSHLRHKKSKRVKLQFAKDLEARSSNVKQIERLLGKRLRQK